MEHFFLKLGHYYFLFCVITQKKTVGLSLLKKKKKLTLDYEIRNNEDANTFCKKKLFPFQSCINFTFFWIWNRKNYYDKNNYKGRVISDVHVGLYYPSFLSVHVHKNTLILIITATSWIIVCNEWVFFDAIGRHRSLT